MTDTFEVLDPATGEVIDTVTDGTVEDATRAVDAAAAAFPAWAATPARVRAEILRRCYDLMIRDADLLTGLIASENGKSVADARAEVTYAAEFFRWFSEETVRGEGTYADAPAGNAKTMVTHVPVGVAALITPWNFPAAMATRKIAPALGAGCTVVLKPAAETPLTALAVARILTEAGVPDGVVNVVPTTDAAAVVTTWLEDPRVRKVSFTGSTGVGRMLLRQAADRVMNTSMELGGNAPFVVTADADIDAAVAGAMIAKFRGGGQACTAANRFYVHADVAEEFVEKFGAAVAALKVGPSSDESNQIGPVISDKALTGITKLVDAAVADGARVAVQGTVPEKGWFFPPTILVDVPVGAPILSEEIFGPVAPIVTWTDEEALLASVNDTEFGLAAYVYAGRLQDALRLGERIEAGMIGINRGIVSDPAAPFGGVKQSGIGREGAHEGIREYQETRYFSVDWS
ncbi:NAD-dependent succinate-semialdehyde dehydrogenase [Nocardioides albidus]|uniref:NAD-dependent succinate-semialdehyde dehydrogenase n=1 Tax=Nocardioides albidus TaxID=1517589 RepID=A0A5C4W795_9ACTN|nr:NAD-dependent succinate-semialdehyde dehydrogenase [Nocardioides albidus]TNM43249.1 NAD-dependent succinate-semialdehyde dehydrogenase [Nocardioides albidus]